MFEKLTNRIFNNNERILLNKSDCKPDNTRVWAILILLYFHSAISKFGNFLMVFSGVSSVFLGAAETLDRIQCDSIMVILKKRVSGTMSNFWQCFLKYRKQVLVLNGQIFQGQVRISVILRVFQGSVRVHWCLCRTFFRSNFICRWGGKQFRSWPRGKTLQFSFDV